MKKAKQEQSPQPKKPVFIAKQQGSGDSRVLTPPNQIKFNQFGKVGAEKFNPGTFKIQHKG
ncbi:MAG: hypothetical protein A2782_01765 [Candidatus Blackburnbacteria bacterium RIFCSPHIGHO2_01_FULL_43_15b]|uniref:Uncharacterized protein n=1 Tax=Candidatus Blackburnbacteria bacterium RIFCSPHIGHO2_01_FULL_43_15b TaxID=1797513 RepID=A0A1G1V1F3_9BACT|nr:MAG: hypothetical protein A2782_01765 [Candidatus Blackburnbacteria bacterium RIFCSPHIGHO2_01_FULL_43_15b]